ncbi:MAG: D-alanyl-D-alanine carboxypeptidase [Alphaproteobacteria bacterium]|nr:D-alanyl-D-alanine carboxypeptidase [Alphaproteobacteria bacterium]
MKKLLSVFFIFNFAFCASRADFSTSARSAFLLDPVSGAGIVNKAGDTLMPPSSMLKLMTLAIAFDAIKDGRLKMEDQLPVSANADHKNRIWAMASKICLTRGQTLSVNDAIMGLIVMSGGDAGVVLAEHLTGSESAMAELMTRRARDIGMSQSTFGNVSGLSHPDNLMTSRELAILALYLIETHPDFYPLFATRVFEFGGYEDDWCREWGRLKTRSYNRLLFMMPGAEGMKTGHTSEGGYGMVATATRGGRRLIAVINGLSAKNHNALAVEAKRLLEHGFNNTSTRVFYQPGDIIVEIPMWYGRSKVVPVTVNRTFAVTLSKGQDTSGLRILARYKYPAVAPVRPGDELGEIIAQLDGQEIARAPLVAKEKVGKVVFIGRIIQNLKIILGTRD